MIRKPSRAKRMRLPERPTDNATPPRIEGKEREQSSSSGLALPPQELQTSPEASRKKTHHKQHNPTSEQAHLSYSAEVDKALQVGGARGLPGIRETDIIHKDFGPWANRSSPADKSAAHIAADWQQALGAKTSDLPRHISADRAENCMAGPDPSSVRPPPVLLATGSSARLASDTRIS